MRVHSHWYCVSNQWPSGTEPGDLRPRMAPYSSVAMRLANGSSALITA